MAGVFPLKSFQFVLLKAHIVGRQRAQLSHGSFVNDRRLCDGGQITSGIDQLERRRVLSHGDRQTLERDTEKKEWMINGNELFSERDASWYNDFILVGRVTRGSYSTKPLGTQCHGPVLLGDGLDTWIKNPTEKKEKIIKDENCHRDLNRQKEGGKREETTGGNAGLRYGW